MTILSIALIFFLIVDPMGKISALIPLLEGVKNPTRLILREMFLALGLMILFNYIGEALFEILSISETTVLLSSGVIIFLAAIKILFPPKYPTTLSIPKGEPFLVPIAIPMVAGPALLATIMLFGHISENTQSEILLSILIAWIGASIIFLFAVPLKRILKTTGLVACEKLMAMILVMLAIQRFMDGVQSFTNGS